ncbi:glycosyltransferase, partial [Candidatus Woesearchaeota archaeon]|nr:glycosyltransferase [Candidatus Woesearchaeota archaeon]
MKNKKKLLIATDSFLPRWDGIARFLFETIPSLAEKYEVTVVAPAFRGRAPSFPGVSIVRIPSMKVSFGDYSPPKARSKKIRSLVNWSDLVFAQSIVPTLGGLAIYYGHKLGKPVVKFTHSIDWKLVSEAVKRGKKPSEKIAKSLTRFYNNRCDLIIYPSENAAREFRKIGVTTYYKVVSLGVDTDKFRPAKSKSEAKKKIGIKPGKTVVGFCGRIGREKDIPTLLRAFRSLQRQDTELLIVGQGVHELEKLLIKQKNVVFRGSQNNVLPFFRAMDIYVLPSLTETSSLSTMEAMSCGIPVICTPVGKMKDYIKDMKNGMFFPAK